MQKHLWKTVAVAAVLMMSVLALTALAQEKKSDPAAAGTTAGQMKPGCAMHGDAKDGCKQGDMKACSMKGGKHGDMKACSMKGDKKGGCKQGDMKACSMKGEAKGCCKRGDMKACSMKGDAKGCCKQGDMKAGCMKKGMGKGAEGGSTEGEEKSD